ncbi:2-oxoglutarate and oxygenase superfamily protein [Perilla frutescens var. hirtella]|uniref:2-oxoglutarate and oxygenase superfamily protein n=1 Tax=Perilla frutescens var. hirtella TaxID=608512 RepID=A0AAD4P348_PERFH|nr:2-oxoglutarate and oxygenase superfamily protein [Perilla frutescens var. hirtella]
MTSIVQSWPEPVVRVQHLSDSGIRVIPDRYVKKPSDRPSLGGGSAGAEANIPVIDMAGLYSGDASLRRRTAALIDDACREWGFFQVVNHGVSHELLARSREVWREFFQLPLAEKQKLANSPATYEGYGSRLGVSEGISLDWSDYFFLHYLPVELRNEEKWPTLPVTCRELVAKYSREVVELCGKLMKIFASNLGLREDYLLEAFGGDEELGACMRVNYYPKCPQPDLTLGLSAHSDPGGMTVLYPDENVSGLQVRRGNTWITVKPVPNAFIVNLGDQLQILSNENYKSVEHRVIVNSAKERVSLAFFYNPKGENVIKPAEELVTTEQPSRYPPTTFNEYRLYIRMKGPCGKSQVESL